MSVLQSSGGGRLKHHHTHTNKGVFIGGCGVEGGRGGEDGLCDGVLSVFKMCVCLDGCV